MPRPLASILLASASSDSVVSGTSQVLAGLEMTEEQHLLHLSTTSSSDAPGTTLQQESSRNSSRRRRPLRQGLASLSARLSSSKHLQQQQDDLVDVRSTGDLSRAIHIMNEQSYMSRPPVDRDAVTVSGMYSVGTTKTSSSLDTVKASNKAAVGTYTTTATPPPTATTKSNGNAAKVSPNNTSGPTKKERWKGLKKAMQVVRSASLPDKQRSGNKSAQDPSPAPLQNRSRSAGSTETAACSTVGTTLPEDELKRGRWDGMDVLSLGSAFERIWTRDEKDHNSIKTKTSDTVPWNAWTVSCTGAKQTFSPPQAVQTMLQTAAGQTPPDMILEGFCESERWSLRIEHAPQQDSFPALQAKTSTDGGLPDMPTQKVWGTLWGSQQPAPASTLPTLEEVLGTSQDEEDGNAVNSNKSNNLHGSSSGHSEDDPLLDLAAESSVPIDVDEDTFIVSTPEHLDAIHTIASVPIAAGKFAAANRIFRKLLLGLDSAVSETHIKDNLRGATCHNMGILNLWQGYYSQAAESFGQAVEARRNCPLVSSRDVAVSLVRQGQSLFALGKFAQALKCFEQALTSTTQEQVVRAKILTNLGVVHYHLRDLPRALDAFTQALSIQRKWLDEPIRRESLIYEAAVTLSNMGKLYLERGDDAMASFVYEEALLLQKTVFRKEHFLIVESLQNLAFSLAKQSQGPKAIKLLERCRRIQVSLYGSNSAQAVMETCGWMAHLCAREHKTAQAQALYQAVYAWQKAFLPSKHAAREQIRACLDELPYENVPLAGWL